MHGQRGHLGILAAAESPAAADARAILIRWIGCLLLSSVVCAVFIGGRYVAAADPSGSAGSALFRIAMLVAHLGMLAAIALSPAILLAWLRVSPHVVRPLAVMLASGFLLALLLDTEVYRLYRFHIDAGVINLLLGGAVLETFIFPRSMYLQAGSIVLGVVAGISLLGWLLWWLVLNSPPRPTFRRAVIAAFLVCVAGFHGIHIWADARAVRSLTVQTDVLPLPYAATAKRLLRRLGFELQPREDLRAVDSDSFGLEYPLRPIGCTRVSQPANIVLILIDSWRFDAMNPLVTPHIARFADRAAVFSNHLSGGNATRIGVFSLFYSIPGTYWHRALDETRGPVVVRELLAQDYDVRVFRSAPLVSPEFDRTVFVDVKEPRLRSDGSGPAQWDRDLTDDFQAYLRRTARSRPFFAFLFYDSPHSFVFPDDHPKAFEPSAESVNYLELDHDTDPRPLRNRYLNSINYVDSLVGEVLNDLEGMDLLEDTIVVITSDHGQEFNDNGANFWGHNSNFSRYQTGVPLVWYEPGRGPAVYQHRTSHFDVMPTLLGAALDCDVPFSAVSVGRPLFEDTPRDVMVLSDYNTFAIVEPDRIAVVKPSGVAVFRPPYERVREVRLAPEVVRTAIEQKSRFYRTEEPQG